MIGEFAVGLVNDEQDVLAETVAETADLACRDAGSGRVAGIGEEDAAGIRPDSFEKGVCRRRAVGFGRRVEPGLACLRGTAKIRVGVFRSQNRTVRTGKRACQAAYQFQ